MVMVRASAEVVRKQASHVAEEQKKDASVAAKKSGKKESVKPAQKKTATPATSDTRKGFTVGVTSGLQVHEFWGLLFSNQDKAKLSDAQLEAAVKKEFPLREKVQPATRLRGWYNCGTYANLGLAPGGKRGTAGQKPPRCLRYVDGLAVGRGAPKSQPLPVVRPPAKKEKKVVVRKSAAKKTK